MTDYPLEQGNLRGEKVDCVDGLGLMYRVWYPHDDVGETFEIHGNDIDDLITLLTVLRDAKPDIYSIYRRDG